MACLRDLGKRPSPSRFFGTKCLALLIHCKKPWLRGSNWIVTTRSLENELISKPNFAIVLNFKTRSTLIGPLFLETSSHLAFDWSILHSGYFIGWNLTLPPKRKSVWENCLFDFFWLAVDHCFTLPQSNLCLVQCSDQHLIVCKSMVDQGGLWCEVGENYQHILIPRWYPGAYYFSRVL